MSEKFYLSWPERDIIGVAYNCIGDCFTRVTARSRALCALIVAARVSDIQSNVLSESIFSTSSSWNDMSEFSHGE